MKKEIDWIEVQKFHDEGNGYREICEKFGLNTSLISKAKKEGLLKMRSRSESNVLSCKLKPRKHSEETKKKISEIRKNYLKEHPDKVPYLLNHYSKGPSYPEIYFDNIFKGKFEYETYYPVSIYQVDIAVVNRKIAIEIDGEQHYVDKRIVKSNIGKDEYLKENGWDIIRIRWSDYQKMIKEEKEIYIKNLINYIKNLIDIKPEIKIIKYECFNCGKEISKRSESGFCRKCYDENRSINNKDFIKIDNRENKRLRYFCIECGINKVYCKDSKCVKCYSISNRKIKDRPSLEQLIKDIEELGYRGTGRKYEVSDNCIRKWIKNYKK